MDEAVTRLLMFGVLPLWALAGVGDWWCHRRDRIEHTAGVGEALLHGLMLGTLGSATIAVLLLEVNAAVLVGITLASVAHEVLFWCDLAHANRHRRIGAFEQWIHCVQFAVPWASLAALWLLHRDQALALVGLGTQAADWSLMVKQPPLPSGYVVAALAGCTAAVVLPFLEELLRCVRARAVR
jgi:NADH:ubiquinone oxidoreductase subunit H